MESNIKLGRIWGIPIGLHYTWFFIFALVTWSLAVGLFPLEYPNLHPAAYWILGAITSLLFFGSVLVHELAHALVALYHRVPVRGISLFIFGGVAEMTEEPRSAKVELRVAAAGPLASFVLAILFGGLWFLDQHIAYLAAPSIWLARINLLLAAFNLIPGFPLDGGRILRAVIWWHTGNLYRATQVATVSGQVVALGFISFGVFVMVSGSFFNGLWLVFIGWFLQNAAMTSYAQSAMRTMLEGVKVEHAMTQNYYRVPRLLPLSQLVEERIDKFGQQYFLVGDGDQPEGLLTANDINDIPERKLRFLTTNQAMHPLKNLTTVEPDTELLDALQIMQQSKLRHIPVVKNNEFVGLLAREHIVDYVQNGA